jgi:hypothetical protein
MANSLLYFPYIDLPQSDWTIRSLLYYEKIGSIVPSDYFSEPEKNYDPFMLDLVKRELVIPINPLEILGDNDTLTEPFLNFLLAEEKAIFLLGALNEGTGKLTSLRQTYHSSPARVNSQKFNANLLYRLTKLGLAKHSNGNWYDVEHVTANYLIAFLASVLANKLGMIPVTDKPFSHEFLQQFKRIGINYDAKRNKILQELIPFPQEIDLTKLQKFKEKHHDLLKRFINVVEQIALNPNFDNETLFNEKVKELKFEKKALTAKMNESKFGAIFFGTACGIFGALQGLTVSETTGAFVGGLPGFASAIYAALQFEKAENTFDQTGMKYLSLIDKKHIRMN